VRWRIRAFVAAADRECVEALWRAAMPPSWPLLPAGVALLGEGLITEAAAFPSWTPLVLTARGHPDRAGRAGVLTGRSWPV
jgi:hypothetical protein